GMVVDDYAEVLHAAGLAVLLFDHEGFGRSDGEQGVISRWLQLRGYEHAVAFVRSREGVDASRIVLWGDSFSGAVSVALAAFYPAIAALVVQVPACGARFGDEDADGSQFMALAEFARGVDPTDARVGDPHPVVELDLADVDPLLTDSSAAAWFREYGRRSGSTWRNEARMALLRAPAPFTMSILAPHVECP